MIIEELNNVEIKYFKVDKVNNFNETDCFEYYKSIGYKVYFGYGSILRGNTGLKNTRVNIPTFPKEVIDVFKKYKSGEPDILVEKDDIWEFIEVKTTNDSLHPNQLIFINELSRVYKTSIHHFINITIKGKSKKINTSFERDLDNLIKLQIKRNYKIYWVISKMYEKHPKFTKSIHNLNTISNRLKLKNATVLWYLDKNGKEILKDAVKDLDNIKLTTKKEKLLKEYKMLLNI